MYGAPRRSFQTTCVSLTSPRPPGRTASVGPSLPDAAKIIPAANTGEGATQPVKPLTFQRSRPVCGSYPRSSSCAATTNSCEIFSAAAPLVASSPPAFPTGTRIGVLHERNRPGRSVFHFVAPV